MGWLAGALITQHCQSNTNQQQKISYLDVKTGLELVTARNFSDFEGKRLGIICNHTALDKNGQHIIDLFHNSSQCTVQAIFAPEHGFRGSAAAGDEISNEIDEKTGVKIYSLYGEINKPTPEMLADLDILIYDIQDVGARFYTYIATMTNCMESAAENNLPFVVLDRPNPIRGDRIEGPLLQPEYTSFVGPHPIPIRYGLTCGELARLINGEGWLANAVQADLQVITVQGWQRSFWYDETGLPWIAPSPNMTDLATAVVYPGFCLLEGTNLSEGRGTDSPFLQFGAPWIQADSYVAALNQLQLPGIVFSAVRFTPVDIPNRAIDPKYENQECQGLRIEITNRDQFLPLQAITHVLATTLSLYPEQFQWRERSIDLLSGSETFRQTISQKLPLTDLFNSWQTDVSQFRELIKPYLLYE
jgi:uncharacterized protein YbbC (DUF1343 family)